MLCFLFQHDTLVEDILTIYRHRDAQENESREQERKKKPTQNYRSKNRDVLRPLMGHVALQSRHSETGTSPGELP